MERKAIVSRKTSETDVLIELNLDGSGRAEIGTGFKFMDHMLVLLARHSGIDLTVEASGDLTHHIIEDIGISLGEAFVKALGEKKGINRYGYYFVPMDEVLAEMALDISNVMLICTRCSKPTRVGHRHLEDGRKVRVCRACGEVID